MKFLRTLWGISGNLTNRDALAPDVPLSSVFGSTLRSSPWPTVSPRMVANPGNASNAEINEFSWFLAQMQDIFNQYLDEIECDIERFFGAACSSSSASTLKLKFFSPSLLVLLVVLIFYY